MSCTLLERALHFVVLLCVWPALSGASFAQEDTAEFPSDEVDGPALQFGDDVYTRDQFGAWLLREFGVQQMRAFAFAHEMERRAGELGADLSIAPDVEAAAADFETRIANAFGGDRDAWLAELERTGHTQEGVYAMRVAEERHMRLSEFVARAEWEVKEHHIVREWEQRYGPGGRGITLRALHLRFVPPTLPPATSLTEQTKILDKARAEHLAVAQAVRAEITSLADFPAAVAKYSEHEESKANGGLWPNILRQDEWPRDNVDALVDLPAGTITEPIIGKRGLWIFAIENVVLTQLDDVKEQLAKDLAERGPLEMDRAEYLTGEEQRMEVQIDDAALDTDSIGQLREAALTVDGRAVPLREFARWLIDTQGETYVDLFASRVATANVADERGLTISTDELALRVDREIVWMLEHTGFKGSKSRWLQRLQSTGMDEASWRRLTARRLQSSLLAEKIIVNDRIVTEELVRDVFIERYGASGERMDVRQIVFALDIEPRAELETNQDWMERMLPAYAKVRERIEAAQARHAEGEDFMALAERFSDDRSSLANGARPVGGFDESTAPEMIVASLRDLPIGKLSEPQVYGANVVLYEVVAREKVEFESVRAELAEFVAKRQPSAVDVALFFNGLVQKSPPKVLPGMWR